MPRVSDAYRKSRRDQILAAAKLCFAATGFHQTTMDDICRGSGLSPGAVYRYFAGKDEIIEALAAEDAVESAGRFREAASGGRVYDALERLVDQFFAELHDPARPAGLSLEVWAEAARNPRVKAALAEVMDAVREAMTELIRRGQAEGEIDPDLDPRSVADALVALHSGRQMGLALEGVQRAADFTRVAKAMVGGLFRTVSRNALPAGIGLLGAAAWLTQGPAA